MPDLLATVDLLAGGVLLVLAATATGRSRRSGVLAGAAGVAWFAAPLSPALLLLHRPLVLHAALALPSGRVHRRYPRWVLALAWSGALVTPLGRHPLWMLLVGALAAVDAARLLSGASAGGGGRAGTAGPAVALLSLSLTLPAVARLVTPSGAVSYAVAALYSGLVLCAGLALLVGVLMRASGRETDAIIELTEGTSAQTAATLRRAAAARDDAPGRAPLMAAAELLETNAALQAELAAKVEEVRASRRRLVDAVVTERQRLEGALAAGAVRHLDELSDTLHELDREQARSSLVSSGGGGSPSGSGSHGASALTTSCLKQVSLCLEDLRLLAGGAAPAGADRERAGAGARRAGHALTGADPGAGAGRAARAGCGGGGLVRLRGGAGQRREARARLVREH